MRLATPHTSDTQVKIAALTKEMDEIHRANSLYWNQGQHPTKAATARYEFRQERLEQIRKELEVLRGPT
jgi:hypothetical protein